MATGIALSTSSSPSRQPVESPGLLNLLILDHDRFVREACREAAASLGYRATATNCIQQALWLVESQTMDVVFLDMSATGGVGLDVLERVKRRRPDCEVVVMINNGPVNQQFKQ
jgi:DNA-binding NtrC family response regulator